MMAPVEKTGLYHPRGLSARTSSGERGGEGAAIHRKGSNDTRESWGVEMQGYDRLGCGLPDEDDETESKEISHGETSSMGVTFNLCNAILGEDPCRGVAHKPFATRFSATAVRRRLWWQPTERDTGTRVHRGPYGLGFYVKDTRNSENPEFLACCTHGPRHLRACPPAYTRVSLSDLSVADRARDALPAARR